MLWRWPHWTIRVPRSITCQRSSIRGYIEFWDVLCDVACLQGPVSQLKREGTARPPACNLALKSGASGRIGHMDARIGWRNMGWPFEGVTLVAVLQIQVSRVLPRTGCG